MVDDGQDQKPKWDSSVDAISSRSDEVGNLARKHGISVDRAQMLIDRVGLDPEKLDAAAEKLLFKPGSPPSTKSANDGSWPKR